MIFVVCWVIGVDIEKEVIDMYGFFVIVGYGFFVIGFGIGVGLIFVVYVSGVVC